ncbi:hypothetical protein [Bacillus sp. FJAT-22090]|nr:hypothetical protein [Bacillus sp. FJAT-22090]
MPKILISLMLDRNQKIEIVDYNINSISTYSAKQKYDIVAWVNQHFAVK